MTDWLLDLRQLLGKLIRVRGTMKPQKNIFEIKESSDLSQIDQLPINSFFTEKELIRFKSPILFEFSYESDEYVLTNDRLGVLAISKTMNGVIEEAKEQISLIWKEYVECPEKDLTKDAIRFREFLKSRVT